MYVYTVMTGVCVACGHVQVGYPLRELAQAGFALQDLIKDVRCKPSDLRVRRSPFPLILMFWCVRILHSLFWGGGVCVWVEGGRAVWKTGRLFSNKPLPSTNAFLQPTNRFRSTGC
jgi:hypothetical protein